jgi:hypothetical protein
MRSHEFSFVRHQRRQELPARGIPLQWIVGGGHGNDGIHFRVQTLLVWLNTTSTWPRASSLKTVAVQMAFVASMASKEFIEVRLSIPSSGGRPAQAETQ